MLEKTFHSNLPRLSEYKNMGEDDIVLLAKQGDTLAYEFLLRKYKKLVMLHSVHYFLVGGDSDDVVQEGMLGLSEAVDCYEPKKGSTFRSFLKMCVKRKILTAIKKATSKKHEPLNNYISFNMKLYSKGTERTILDTLQAGIISDPMEVYIEEESMGIINKDIKRLLSQLEYKVFTRFLDGKCYDEISQELGKNYKCIDNSIQRIRKKLISYCTIKIDKEDN